MGQAMRGERATRSRMMGQRSAKLNGRVIKKPPVLFQETQAIIRKIAKITPGVFLSYWNSSGGDVCSNDVSGFFEILKRIGKVQQLTLCIKSGGGSGRASLRIVNLLRQHAARITAVVPLECASAATMMALGADEIQMGPMAYLTAIDSSITHDLSPVDKDNDLVSVSQNEMTRIINVWRKEARGTTTNPYQALFPHVHPLVIGAVDRASSLSIRLCQEILSHHMKGARHAAQISRYLNAGYPSHSYPITLNEARRIGLKARVLDPRLNDLLIELNELYSEMGQRAITNFDERNYHNNAIVNILEGHGIQLFYQYDKDWHYRTEERRWVPLNDQTSWHKIEERGRRMTRSVFHIR